MGDRAKKKAELKKQSEKAAMKADEILATDLEALKNATKTDIEGLRPKVEDQETYDRLIAVVEESTRNNESLAQLKGRIEKLGATALSLAKSVVRLLG